MRRALLLCMALACAVAARAQGDEHRPAPPIPAVSPWMTGADLLRKLNTPAQASEALDYIKGAHDATEHREWCYRAPDFKPVAKPRPVDLLAMMRAALTALPPDELKRSAGALLLDFWQAKWPCPSSDGTGCCP